MSGNDYPLRAKRENLGLSLIQVAVKAKVSPQLVAKFELVPDLVQPAKRARLLEVYAHLDEVA